MVVYYYPFLQGLEKRKRELGIHSSIVRSSKGHDGDNDDNENVLRRYNANKLNNISEGLTLNNRFLQSELRDDEIDYEKDTIGRGHHNIGSSATTTTTTTTMNPLHTQNMV